MTKKDYEIIAAAIAKVRNSERANPPPGQHSTLILVVHELCLALKADNPRFDAERFWEATHG